MQPPSTPPEDGLEPTVAMPRVEPPPPRPYVEHAVVEPPHVAHNVPVAAPVTGTVLPPRPAAGVSDRPQYVFGNPLGYAVARFFAFVLDIALVTVFVTSLAYALIAINPLTGLPTNTQSGFEATLGIGIAVASNPPVEAVGRPVSGLIAMSAYASDVTNTVTSAMSSTNAKKRATT